MNRSGRRCESPIILVASLHQTPFHDGTAADEAALLAQLAAGDAGDPVVELYRRYGPRLYALGVRVLYDRTLAEELVQETFVRVWQGAHRYDPAQGSVRTWMLTIARRVAIDLQRRAAARPRAAAHSRAPSGTVTDPLDELWVEDDLDRLFTAIEVRAAMETLSDAHREVLQLAYDEQLTQSEVAERIGVPLGTVKTRTFHALRELRNRLGNEALL